MERGEAQLRQQRANKKGNNQTYCAVVCDEVVDEQPGSVIRVDAGANHGPAHIEITTTAQTNKRKLYPQKQDFT